MQRACVLAFALTVSELSVAGGFSLIEHGASGLGNAYAGAAAVSLDASTIWFNPAGMTELKEKQFIAAGHIIDVDSEFTDQGTTLNSAFGGDFVDPNFGTPDALGPVDAGGTAFLPNLYYVHPLKKGVTLGIGLGIPYGNSTDYDPTWVGRYQAVESSVTAIDINPSISYRVNDVLNIGGGISVQYLTANIGNAVDSGGTCFGLASAGQLALADCLGAGLTGPGIAATDGFADVEGDSTAFTFNFGLLYKPRAGTNLGFAFRSGVEHELEGTADFTNNPAFETLLGSNGIPLFLDGDVTADADLPPTAMFSIAHKATDRLQLLADATFTGGAVLMNCELCLITRRSRIHLTRLPMKMSGEYLQGSTMSIVINGRLEVAWHLMKTRHRRLCCVLHVFPVMTEHGSLLVWVTKPMRESV